MTTTNTPRAFTDLSGDDVDNQLTEIESLCMNCYEKGRTRLLLTRIPYYKDVIISSFQCESCHFSNNDVQPAQPYESYGILINVHVLNSKDLNRQFVKSSHGTVRIKELDFEQPPSNEACVLTTIEGFLDTIIENIGKTIEQIDKTLVDLLQRDGKASNGVSHHDNEVEEDDKNISQFEEQKKKLAVFVARLRSFKSSDAAAFPSFHFEIDDPTGNSFIENPRAPHRDEQMTVRKYVRTPEQNALLNISDEEAFENEQIFVHNSTEIGQDEILTFQTNCPSCNVPCDTNMKMTTIPHFKEVIIMATSCDACGNRSNEIKSGTGIAPRGVRYRLVMNDVSDLNRDVLVSEMASFSIPDLDFELSSSQSIGGRFTTIEGLMTTLRTQLSSIVMPFSRGDSRDPSSDQGKMCVFVNDIALILAGEKFVTIELDDPTGNSYVQNVYAPDPDPQLTVDHYERTDDQDEMLGLKDMNTENYQTNEKS